MKNNSIQTVCVETKKTVEVTGRAKNNSSIEERADRILKKCSVGIRRRKSDMIDINFGFGVLKDLCIFFCS